MKTQHTPGPWRIDYEHNTNFSKAISISVKTHDGKGKSVYFHHLNDGMDEESEANARLIAAAPELLEALNAIVAAEWVIQTAPCILKAKEAIKKATE